MMASTPLRGATWRRSIRACVCLVALAACGWLTAPCGAQPEPGSDGVVFARKGSGSPITDGHGWMVTRESAAGSSGGGSGRIVLQHLPPRLGDAGDLSGVVRRVLTVDAGETAVGGSEGGMWAVSGGGVDGIAWNKNRVYLLMPEEAAAGGAVRRVLMVSAIHGAGTTYEYAPPGRALSRASLPSPSGGSAVVGFSALPGTPPRDRLAALLVGRGSEGAGDRGLCGAELWMMDGDSWRRATAPWEQSEGGMVAPKWRWRQVSGGRWAVEPVGGLTVQLLDWREGVALGVTESGSEELSVWVGELAAGATGTGTGKEAALRWHRTAYPLRRSNAQGGVVPVPIRLAMVHGQIPSADVLLGLSRNDQKRSVQQLFALRPSGPVQLESLEGVPEEADLVPMAAPADGANPAGRLALVWNSKSAERADRTLIREVSAASGLLVFEGTTRVGEFVDRRRLQALTIFGVLAMVGVLVFVLRVRDGTGTIEGVRSVRPVGRGPIASGEVRAAEPLRRLGAAVLDYAPSAILVAMMQGRDAVALLTPSTMFGGTAAMSGDMDLGPFGLAIVVTVLHTSLLEWLFGRSIGKFILGVRVVDVRAIGSGAGGFVRPALWQALVRNTVRWAAPLLAVLALLDEMGRHPGDLAGQTLVVADPNDGS